jgi:hypothetical protein
VKLGERKPFVKKGPRQFARPTTQTVDGEGDRHFCAVHKTVYRCDTKGCRLSYVADCCAGHHYPVEINHMLYMPEVDSREDLA